MVTVVDGQAPRRRRGGGGNAIPFQMYKEWENRINNDIMGVRKEFLNKRFDYTFRGKDLFIPQFAEFETTKTIAGHGSGTKLRIAESLSENFGGSPEIWSKKVGKIESELYVFDMHWYERKGDSRQFLIKKKHQKPKKI